MVASGWMNQQILNTGKLSVLESKEIGKRLFKSKEEAEQALERMKGNG